jgi:ArsR family transcriptional regulator, arsenate/arsenite/antimonite-responsive transcriptional repressor
MNQLENTHRLFARNLPLFSALGDPVRQQLLLLMLDGSRLSVAELALQTELSRPTISHHLKILKQAHIVTSQKVGTKIYYRPQLRDCLKPVRELLDTVATL